MGSKFGIIGAGPSGISLSLFLDEKAEIFEQETHPGGFASSFSLKGFTFDYGPHILFSKNSLILDFLVRSLGSNVHRCRRNNKIFFKHRLMKYPFENDLKSLPLEDNFECLYEFVDNPFKKIHANPRNLREWFLHHFGKGICERYLFPYNEKIWKIPVEQLSMIWADRIPYPPVRDVVKSSLGYETEGHLHQLYYFYPLRGGYQAICDSWSKYSHIHFNYEVKEIYPTDDGRFCLSDGHTKYLFDEIISTMPIKELLTRLHLKIPEEVKKAVSRLIVNPILLVSLGLRGSDENLYTAIYFPDPDFWVNRVSFPCTFSPLNGPKGCFSIQAEITCRNESELWDKSDDEIFAHVIEGLLARNIISNHQEIILRDIQRKKYAYVVYDQNYLENVELVRKWFSSKKIHLLGRFSYFEYINLDGVVERSLELSNRINGTEREPKVLIDRALSRLDGSVE